MRTVTAFLGTAVLNTKETNARRVAAAWIPTAQVPAMHGCQHRRHFIHRPPPSRSPLAFPKMPAMLHRRGAGSARGAPLVLASGIDILGRKDPGAPPLRGIAIKTTLTVAVSGIITAAA